MSDAKYQVPRPQNEPVLSYAPGTPEKDQIKAELKKQFSQVAEIPVIVGETTSKSRKTINVVCPHDHRHVLAKCQQAEQEDVELAIKTAVQIQKEWCRVPWQERAAIFLKAADLLATRYRAAINAATMLGQSKTVHQAEIDSACELIDFFRFNVWFMQQIYEQQPFSPRGMWNQTEARGLEGFVFAVTPFNFTSIAVNLPTAPVLMGCTTVWKPAATSTWSSWIGFQVLKEAGLPDGVINFVPGDAKLIGELCIQHPDLAGLHFTGSTATFNYLWEQIGCHVSQYKTYPRVVGETGGKDFVFAHPSADTAQLTTALIRGAFEYQGQKCSAASRAYIPQSLWPEVKDRLISEMKEIKMGDPQDFTNFMAAVIDERAFEKIKSYIDHAHNANNAEILVGGTCHKDHGYFIEPTLIEAKVPNYKSMVEEIFGPVLTVFVYDEKDLDQILEICDQSTAYALTGAVFAQDRQAVHYISDKLRYAAGNFYINDKPTGAVVGQQPFGGSRASGTNDKAGSLYNLIRWTSLRTIKENFIPITDYRYPFMQEP